MTATPGSGAGFFNWTDGAGPVLTNGRTLRFMMVPNLSLTAHFGDTQPAVLTVTSPTLNQRVSNAVWTVRGTARDNAQVGTVWYQINGGTWSNAVTLNTWSNWTAEVGLQAGTNVLSAYAEDATGNHSLTNTVRFIYVLSDRLLVRSVGQGTLIPNYSNAVLEIGRSYTLRAAGANGHGFTNWVVSTNWTGGVTVPGATLSFVMRSNLTVQATFADVTRPTLATTSPTVNQRVSNAVWTARGTARDNAQVGTVRYQLNGGSWSNAVTQNSWSNWTAEVGLQVGTNLLSAYAEDATGNHSFTNTVRFVQVVTSSLTLRTNGAGSITRNFTGNILEVGKNYAATAVPRTGQMFSNWTEGAEQVVATRAAYTFPMTSNLVLQANFVANPFVALKGDYVGLFYPTNQEEGLMGATNSGYVRLTLTDKGTFTGSLLLEGSTLSLSGTFDIQRTAALNLPRSSKPALQLNLALDAESRVLSGTVTCSLWHSDLVALRAATGSPNAYAGAYTLAVRGEDDRSEGPPGDGAAAVTVSASGALQITGSLADGTAITQSSAVTEAGLWPFFGSLYGGRGGVVGWMSLDSSEAAGEIFWLRPPLVSGSPYYTSGFVLQRSVVVRGYIPPETGQNATGWRYGRVTVGYGNGPDELSSFVVIANNQVRVWSGAISNLTLTIAANNGQLSGSFMHPVTRRSTSFKGALLQDGLDTVGGGWFLGTNEGGFLRLEATTEAPAEDFAPTSLNGKGVQVQNGLGETFKIYFGNGKFSQDGGEGGTGTYTYARLTTNTARLAVTYTAPPTVAGQGSMTVTVTLTHREEGTVYGTYTAQSPAGPDAGSLTLFDLANLAPASLAGRTIHAEGSTAVMGTSTFTARTGALTAAGSYTYARLSPLSALLKMSYVTPTNIVNYVECTLDALNAGHFLNTWYEPGQPVEKGTGTFSLFP